MTTLILKEECWLQLVALLMQAASRHSEWVRHFVLIPTLAGIEGTMIRIEDMPYS